MTDSQELVKVKVLKPIAQVIGPCLTFGMTAEFPKHEAEIFIKNGDAELYVGVDLVDAVRAVKEAGGEISFEKDNVALIKAFEKLDVGVAEPVVELDEMTVKQLLAKAKAEGIAIPKDAPKAEIVKIINEA